VANGCARADQFTQSSRQNTGGDNALKVNNAKANRLIDDFVRLEILAEITGFKNGLTSN